MTAPELVLWQKIRNNQLGVKFRRQFSIANYILDFYAPSINLAIEIDGDSHYLDKQAVLKDKMRDKFLNGYGIKVLRFTNHEVMSNLEGVIQKIIEFLPPLNLPLIMGEKRKGNK